MKTDIKQIVANLMGNNEATKLDRKVVLTNEKDGYEISTFHYLTEVLEVDEISREINAYIIANNITDMSQIDGLFIDNNEAIFSDKLSKYYGQFVFGTFSCHTGTDSFCMYYTDNFIFKTFSLYFDNGDSYVFIHFKSGIHVPMCFKINENSDWEFFGGVEVAGVINGINTDNLEYDLYRKNIGSYNLDTVEYDLHYIFI